MRLRKLQKAVSLSATLLAVSTYSLVAQTTSGTRSFEELVDSGFVIRGVMDWDEPLPEYSTYAYRLLLQGEGRVYLCSLVDLAVNRDETFVRNCVPVVDVQ